MDAKFLIPVRAHVKKYLEVQHGQQLVVSRRGYLPFLLLQMLEKHAKKDPALVRPSQKLIDNKVYFGYPVYVGATDFARHGAFITTENLKKFNESIDDLIREEMYRWCHHPNATDSVVDFNIRRFMDFYGFEEDELPFDNLKRWYYRERKRLQQRVNFAPPFVPQLILSF